MKLHINEWIYFQWSTLDCFPLLIFYYQYDIDSYYQSFLSICTISILYYRYDIIC